MNKTNPENIGFKNGLAISISKLGSTHTSLGDLHQALIFFEQYNEIKLELYENFPGNMSFKNGLAISYSKLGVIHLFLSNWKESKNNFKKYELHGLELFKMSPLNIGFKSNYGEALAVCAAMHLLEGNEEGLNDLTTAKDIFSELCLHTNEAAYYKRKLAIVEKMMHPGSDLIGLIKEISMF